MAFEARAWFVQILLVSLLPLGIAVAAHAGLSVDSVADPQSMDARDSRGTSDDDLGSDRAFAELDDTDDESSHRPLTLVILSPAATSAPRPFDGGVVQHPAVEPPKPPPRA